MDTRSYILGVDDEPVNRAILQEIFEDDFDFICVEGGQQCLDMLAERTPDLILLDVNMPGMNGLETCKKIRSTPSNAEIPIIFVSALTTPEERLAGYEAGGDDYITKPFVTEELVAKVELTLKQHKSKTDLQQSSDYAMKTAMTAMTSASELGLAVRFLQESFGCHTPQELVKKVFEYTNQYGVEASIIIRQDSKYITLFSDGIERPLEASALEQLRSKGRIYTLANKVIINGNHASLLIRDLPMDEEEKVGRLRDHLAVLLDGIDARLEAIDTSMALEKRKQALAAAIESTREEIIEIDKVNRLQQTGVNAEISNIAKNIEAAFITLGLTEEQEQSLINIVNKAESNTDELYKKGIEIDQRFTKIIDKLKNAL